MFSITTINNNNRKIFENLLINKHYDIMLGLQDDNQPCGLICASLDKEVLWINNLYVVKEVRRRGGATELVDAAVDIGYECGARVIKAKWNRYESQDDIYMFLYALGFDNIEDTMTYYSIALEDMALNRHLESAKANAKNLVYMSSNKVLFNTYISKQRRKGIILLESDEYEQVEPDLSGVYVYKGKECGIIIVNKNGDELLFRNIFIEQNISVTARGFVLMEMIKGSLERAFQKYHSTTKVLIQPVNMVGKDLLMELIGDYARPVSKLMRYEL